MPYPHVLCDIVPEALDAAVLAARGSGQPQKAVTLPGASSDIMIFLSCTYTILCNSSGPQGAEEGSE